MESPFDRLDRRLRDELRIGDRGYASSDAPTPSLPSGYNMPGLENVDLTYGDVSTGTVEPVDLPRAPLSAQGSRIESGGTPLTKRDTLTEATGSHAIGNSWNGITDLRSTPLNARFAKTKPVAGSKLHPTSSRPHTLTALRADDSDDDIRLNMSPPVTMTFNLPPRAQAVLDAGRTPVRSARKQGEARMILDDLMEEMGRGYEPSPRMPTPEGLGRYSVVPRELGLGPGGMLFDGDETSHPPRKSMANTSFGSEGVIDHHQSQAQGLYQEDEDSFDVDDSFDSPAPAGPSRYVGDPPAQVDDSYISMSPNTSEAGMIFGGPPQQDGVSKGRFSLMKPDEMMTYHGGRLEDAAGRDVVDSPTHALAQAWSR